MEFVKCFPKFPKFNFNRMLYPSILNNLSLNLQISSEIQSHYSYFVKIQARIRQISQKWYFCHLWQIPSLLCGATSLSVGIFVHQVMWSSVEHTKAAIQLSKGCQCKRKVRQWFCSWQKIFDIRFWNEWSECLFSCQRAAVTMFLFLAEKTLAFLLRGGWIVDLIGI